MQIEYDFFMTIMLYKKKHTNDLRCLVIAYEVKKKEDTICSICH